MSQKNHVQSTPPPRFSSSLPYWSTAQQVQLRQAKPRLRPLLERLRGERRARRRRRGEG